MAQRSVGESLVQSSQAGMFAELGDEFNEGAFMIHNGWKFWKCFGAIIDTSKMTKNFQILHPNPQTPRLPKFAQIKFVFFVCWLFFWSPPACIFFVFLHVACFRWSIFSAFCFSVGKGPAERVRRGVPEIYAEMINHRFGGSNLKIAGVPRESC